MRIVWIVGGPPAAATNLEKVLTVERTGVPFKIRTTSSITEIPEAHIQNPGVMVLLDAFAPENRGLGALRSLRGRGFRGPTFVFGEPAPEEASAAFRKDGLTGFFPAFERADLGFVGGLLQASVDYDGSVDVQKFISPSGRSSFETIRSLRDFNAFTAKLSTFVSRFGIDLPRLRKVLMALSLPHVKSETGTPSIDTPFPIHYGMDPYKVVLACPTFSRGAALDALASGFASSVEAANAEKSYSGGMFPEFFHLSRATQNVVLLSGSSQSTHEGGTPDPLFMLTTIPFPPKDSTVAPRSYFFSLVRVIPTAEILEDDGPAPAAAPVEAAPAAEADVPASTKWVDQSDISDLLAEPKVVGDAPEGFQAEDSEPEPEESLSTEEPEPVALDFRDSDDTPIGEGLTTNESPAFSSSSSSSGSVSSMGGMLDSGGELSRKLGANEAELDRLRKVSEALSQDVKRLMKERRQPTTDRELRDSNQRLQEQVKSLTAEKLKHLEMIASREKQIDLMKVQIETLKKEKAA